MNRRIAATAIALYVLAIVVANYWITHGPGTPTPFHTYTLPVGFGLTAPAGTYMAALTFPLRDFVQRWGGRVMGLAAIALAALVSWWVSNPAIAIASSGTWAVAELCDFFVYTPLQRRWFTPAVVASGIVGAVVNALVFLKWAGLPYHGNLAGLIVGPLWIVTLIGGPLAAALRRLLPTPRVAAA